MNKISIEFIEAVDHDLDRLVLAEEGEVANVTIVVRVSLDEQSFDLNYQTTTSMNYEALPIMGLDANSGDEQHEFAAFFNTEDEDGDEKDGRWTEEYQSVEKMARTVAQHAYDHYRQSCEAG